MGISPLMTGSSGSRTSSSETSGAVRVTGPNSPRIDFIGLLLSVCLLFTVAGQKASAEDVTSQGFHFPSTSAEQFLDLIITLESGTGRAELGAYAKSVPWRNVRKDVHYARLVTPGLRDAISREEIQLVKENCGGEYVEGDNCSFGTNPITCSQDYSEDGYLFRAEKIGRNEVVLSLGWPGFSEIIGTYRLVRAGGVWKLDGIRCDPTMSFNMP